MFAILAGYTMSETARDSLFLGSNGAGRLAIVYLLLAGVAIAALAASKRLVRQVGRRYALIITLMAAALGTTIFYTLPRGPEVAFALYLWTGLLGTVVVVQFWLLASTSFTTAEAKRLYGPIAAIGAVGTLAGALIAWGVVSIFRVEHLLPLASLFYLLGAFFLAHEKELAEPRVSSIENRVVRSVPSARTRLWGQGYVVRLCILTVCATSVALLADYLLKSTAAAIFRPDELPQFFARYSGAVSALSLLLQIVGASWLVRKIGVLGMVTLLPVMMLTGGVVAVTTAGSFLAIALTKGADASLRYSVSRVATELLWMPVRDDIRAAIREPLESVMTRLVQAITAGLLLALVALGLGTPTIVAGVVVAITLVWSITAGTLRSSYLSQLRTSVSRRSLATGNELDLNAVESVVEALSSDDDQRVIAAIHILSAHRRTKLIPALVLRHDSIDVLAAALDAIATPERTDWLPLTHRLMRTADPQARTLALRALARVGDQTAIMAGLCDDDAGVLAHAVFWQLQTGAAQPVLGNPAVVSLLQETGDRGHVARHQLLDAIRTHGDARWVDVILELATSGDDAHVELLAQAIVHLPDPRFVPFLLGRIRFRSGRAGVREALVAIGNPALLALEQTLTDRSTPSQLRIHLPSSIALFGTQRAAEILGDQLEMQGTGAMRYRILRGMSRLAGRGGIVLDSARLVAELRLHLSEHFRLIAIGIPVLADPDSRDSAVLLRGLIIDKISQARDRAFLALHALHPRDDIGEIERAVTGADRRTRAHAAEFLDTLTRTPLYTGAGAVGIRDQLLVLGEDLEPRERLVRLGLGDQVPATTPLALAQLVGEVDGLLAACAGFHALQFTEPELADAVRKESNKRELLAPLGIVHAGFRDIGVA